MSKWSTPPSGLRKPQKDWTTTGGSTERRKTGEVTGKTGIAKNLTKRGKAEREEIAFREGRQGRLGTAANFSVSA